MYTTHNVKQCQLDITCITSQIDTLKTVAIARFLDHVSNNPVFGEVPASDYQPELLQAVIDELTYYANRHTKVPVLPATNAPVTIPATNMISLQVNHFTLLMDLAKLVPDSNQFIIRLSNYTEQECLDRIANYLAKYYTDVSVNITLLCYYYGLQGKTALTIPALAKAYNVTIDVMQGTINTIIERAAHI